MLAPSFFASRCRERCCRALRLAISPTITHSCTRTLALAWGPTRLYVPRRCYPVRKADLESRTRNSKCSRCERSLRRPPAMLALEAHRTGSLRLTQRLSRHQIIRAYRRAQHSRQLLELQRRRMTPAAAGLTQQKASDTAEEQPRRVAIFVVGCWPSIQCHALPDHSLDDCRLLPRVRSPPSSPKSRQQTMCSRNVPAFRHACVLCHAIVALESPQMRHGGGRACQRGRNPTSDMPGGRTRAASALHGPRVVHSATPSGAQPLQPCERHEEPL